jgi:pSer/pThr/pTyr-binding forkhead associated (FHA) protein
LSDSEIKGIRISVYEGSKLIFEKGFADLPISFGRNPTNQVQLNYNFMSRSHCTLIDGDDGIYLIDLQSTCGMTVEGQQVQKVHIPDRLTFSIRTLTIQIELPPERVQQPNAPQFRPPSRPPPAPVPTAVPEAIANFQDQNQAQFQDEYRPVVKKDFRPQLIGVHPEVAKATYRKIEAVVSWHDVIYEVREFHQDEPISVGALGYSDLPIPILKQKITIARVGRDKTVCFALRDHTISFNSNSQILSSKEMMIKNILEPKGPGYSWTMKHTDVSSIDFGSGVQLHLRYVPGTRPLTRVPLLEPDEAIKKSLIGSAILHCALGLIVFLGAPPTQHGPKLKNVPDRYARLLIDKVKPKPTPAPTPVPKEVVKVKPPEPKKVAEKKPPKITKQPKVLAKRNKYPMEVEHPMPKAPPPVKVEALGALAALGAISKDAPKELTNININKDAGGLPSKAINTGGIVGALPSTNGKLAAGGSGRVKTKGLGYGTGTGYGIQGLRGLAGSRGVAGAVVGAPKLAQFNEKQEGLTRAQVMEKLKQYMAEVQHCYEKNLLTNPDLAGRIDFEWDISPHGKVTDVRVKRSTVNGGDTLVGCVKNVFFSIPFPSAKNGMITTPTIGFPFGRI